MFKSYEDVMEFNKANVDALVQSGTKMAAGFEEMAKVVFGVAGKTVESSLENAKAVASCKTAAEVIQIQQKMAKENWETMIAEGSKLSEMGTVVAQSAFEPVQNRYKSAVEAFTSAGK